MKLSPESPRLWRLSCQLVYRYRCIDWHTGVWLAGIQTSAARKGMQAAFEASPERLGRIAVKAARKRT